MKWTSAVVVALGVIVGTAVMDAQRPGDGQGPSGFRALRGQNARDFAVPGDMRRVSQERVGRGSRILAERFRQYVGDAEVLGGQVTVYRDDAGDTDAVIGSHYPDLTPSNTVRLSAGNAQGIAAARRNDAAATVTVDLMINPASRRQFYRVESRSADARWFYWIDSETGDLINEYNGLTTAGDDVGVNADTKDVNPLTSFGGGAWRMQTGRQSTYDAKNRNAVPGTLATDADNVWNAVGRTSPGQHALVDAHYYGHLTDAFYQATFNFDWLAHYPQGMVSSAHVQRNWSNASWNGYQMSYGDGDGTSFREMSGDLDVVGHELSHGVTEAYSNLVYQNESGALNEAFSDIMGTAIEFANGSGNWTIGENVTIGSNGIRNMANPGEDGDPSHYADRYTGGLDNGGVHINSGIINHWFYLLTVGGRNATESRQGAGVTGIDIDNAQEIVFAGFTALPATATFCQARSATLAVAGSAASNVASAWNEVGVTETLCGGGTTSGGPKITSVTSQKLKGGKFKISWTTDVASNSVVTFTCCGSYSNASLVTTHSMQFTGSVGASYVYSVSSTDSGGRTSTAGPFTHQN